MKAQLTGIATLLALGVVSGCASSPRTVASMEMRPQSFACNQLTGSRVIASRESTDCGPVGYPFREITAEQFFATGQTNWSSIIQPMR